MVLRSKENLKVSMIADREGLPTLLMTMLNLSPIELNSMKIDSAVRQIDGKKVWTWRLVYTEPPKKK